MRRLVDIAVLVLCALTVAACGSTAPKSPAHTIPVPERDTKQSVQVGAYTQVFDAALPADPLQASVVKGFRAAMILWDKSQESWKLPPPITDWVTGNALSELKATLVRTKAQDVVLAGGDRFFKTRVTALSSGKATINTCDDGSKFEEVNPETGIPDPAYSSPPNQRYVFAMFQMTQLNGRWAISDVSVATLPDSRAKPCQP